MKLKDLLSVVNRYTKIVVKDLTNNITTETRNRAGIEELIKYKGDKEVCEFFPDVYACKLYIKIIVK